MRWTKDDIATFWAMKQEGASLIDIADHLGRDYKAVQNLAYNQKKKRKDERDKTEKTQNLQEIGDVEEVVDEAKPEENTEKASNARTFTPETPQPNVKTGVDEAVRLALEMVAAHGLKFERLCMQVDERSATVGLEFARKKEEKSMIEVKTDKGDTELSMKGTTEELAADALVILRAIYNSLAEDDLRSADELAEAVIGTIGRDDMTPFKLKKKEEEQS